ncbi:MAG: M1 family aminopeptidase, partial [Myxococcales bacterium]|nr:M1 family aminopeptidase [Myxococcales bacterium]
AYALEHTGPMLLALERYYDIAYPYAKLDLIAVPDFGAGAMENAAAITFREWLLLLDSDDAPENQRRAFASVMAHELAHHWFGNLVTMPWWDDIWLNEGFATWSGHRTVEAVHPEHGALVSLARGVQYVMTTDSRLSARRVRQPVPTNRDMGNAFDGITYQKSAGVLTMFERYLGPEVFRKGVRAYLRERAFGVGAAPDLIAALERASGRELAPAFNSFLEQVGVPLLEVVPRCEGARARLQLRQSRYLPLGSKGNREQVWGLPVCVRYQGGEHCTLLTQAQATVELPTQGCPTWLMPNADGAGYYRWSLPGEWLAKLRERGYGQLKPTEKLSLVDSMRAGLASGDLDAAEVFGMLKVLAADPQRHVAVAPTGLLSFAREHLIDEAHRPRMERFASRLYAERFAALGYAEREGEGGDARLLRAQLASFLAEVARDRRVRAMLADLGRAYLGGPDGPLRPELVAADLRRLALSVALDDGDPGFYDRALARLHETEDADRRGDLLAALSSARSPELSARALALSLDERLRKAEVLVPLGNQMADPQTRAAAFRFMQDNFDALLTRASAMRAGRLPRLGAYFCDPARAQELQAFFGERARQLSGGPRNLASALESIALCAAEVKRQRASANAFF